MEEQGPNRHKLQSSAVGTTGHRVAELSLEENRHEEARTPTAVFESSEGRGLQQGIGNTMIVHNYGNSAAAVRQSENIGTSNQTVYFDDGNYTLALQYFNRSLLITNRIHGPNSRHATTLLIRIGKVLQLLGHADAVNYWKQALEIMTRLKMNDILMVSVLYRLAEWHSDRLRLFAAFDYHTRAYYLLRELKEEEQPVFPAARTVPSISTALQSIGSSVSIRNIVQPFITQCREDLFRLKEDLSALAWGTTEEEFLIRMVYMDYYLYYSLAIALLLCLYMKCILLP